MRDFSSWGQSFNSYGPMFTVTILAKLPIETRKYTVCEHCDSEWNVADGMVGLIKEIQTFEMFQCTRQYYAYHWYLSWYFIITWLDWYIFGFYTFLIWFNLLQVSSAHRKSSKPFLIFFSTALICSSLHLHIMQYNSDRSSNHQELITTYNGFTLYSALSK